MEVQWAGWRAERVITNHFRVKNIPHTHTDVIFHKSSLITLGMFCYLQYTYEVVLLFCLAKLIEMRPRFIILVGSFWHTIARDVIREIPYAE